LRSLEGEDMTPLNAVDDFLTGQFLADYADFHINFDRLENRFDMDLVCFGLLIIGLFSYMIFSSVKNVTCLPSQIRQGLDQQFTFHSDNTLSF
jgi:hypothetical protein